MAQVLIRDTSYVNKDFHLQVTWKPNGAWT